MIIDGTRSAVESRSREAFTGPAPDYTAFRRDPKGTVAIWHNMTLDDARAGKRISEYRIMQAIKNMTLRQKKECMRYMLENYNICLDIPPGKIVLAGARDNLDHYADLPPDYVSADGSIPARDMNELLVLVYSIKNEKRNVPRIFTGKVLPHEKGLRKFYDNPLLTESSGNADGIDKKVAKKDENDYLPLVRDGKTLIVSNDQLLYGDFSQVNDALGIVALMNSFIRRSPVNDVVLTREESSYFDPEVENVFGMTPKRVRISIRGSDLRFPASHEMGHAIFSVMLYARGTYHCSNDPDWRNIFRMAETSAFEIFDESNYLKGVRDSYGHPNDNESELLASAVAIFTLVPGELLMKINDPNTPDEMNAVGRLGYCYLRDKVFKGVFARDANGKVVFYAKGTPGYEKHNLIRENWEEIRALINTTGTNKVNAS